MNIGIIGGSGSMGRVFKSIFEKQNIECLISDMNTERSNLDLVNSANVVIIAVPISKTLEIISEISSALNEDQLISDLTSIKVLPVNKMLETKAEVLGLHPMFGPGLDNVNGQTIIACKARKKSLTDSFIKILSNAGLVIKESTPEKHDKLMAAIQGLNHINALLMAKTLADSGVDLTECLEFASPSYKVRSHFLSRLMSESAELYADISLSNPATSQIIELLAKNTTQVLSILKSENKKDFMDLFGSTSNSFSGIKESGLEVSNKIIKYLAGL